MPAKATKTKPKKKAATRTKVGSQARAVKKKEITEDTPLLVTEQRFADEYLKDLNQTQAAIRAGYSPKSAANTATHLMKQPNVAAYIARKLAEQSTRTGVEFERIIRELARVAFVNPARMIDEDGRLRDVSDDDGAAIAGIKVKVIPDEDGEPIVEREIKMTDKNKAMDILLKYSRIGAEFEQKMAVEREKLAMQRRQLELEERRLAMQEAQAAADKDGFSKILNILDPFGDGQKQQNDMNYAEKEGVLSETDNKNTSGGESE